jgi:hypothetical protein
MPTLRQDNADFLHEASLITGNKKSPSENLAFLRRAIFSHANFLQWQLIPLFPLEPLLNLLLGCWGRGMPTLNS